MWWLLWLVVIVAVVLGVVLLALGRGEGLPEEPPDDLVLRLPEGRLLTPSDVETVRLPVAIRGYQMAAVDDLLDRLAAEIALREAELTELRGKGAARQEPGEQSAGL